MRRPAALILMVAHLYIPFATPGCGGQHVDANAALERGDFPTAYRIFKEMADHGEAAGQNGLGFMYVVGQGVPQDYAEGANWFRKAADQGFAKAQYNIGLMYEYGLMYENGQGVPQDYAEAMNWFRRAADQGFAMARYNIGLMYENGQGVPRDYAEAMNWFRKAAEQGYVEAQLNLGASYYKGVGVQQDYTLAYYWLSLAVRRTEGKNENIVEARDMAAKKLKPEQLEKVDQMVKEWKPKKEGE